MIKSEDNEFLHRQLVKLGDMMGDGLHYEPGGKWIEREYKNICRALGIGSFPKKKRDVSKINKAMEGRVANFNCQKCNGKMKQTRSGSMRAICTECGSKYQLLKKDKAKR